MMNQRTSYTLVQRVIHMLEHAGLPCQKFNISWKWPVASQIASRDTCSVIVDKFEKQTYYRTPRYTETSRSSLEREGEGLENTGGSTIEMNKWPHSEKDSLERSQNSSTKHKQVILSLSLTKYIFYVSFSKIKLYFKTTKNGKLRSMAPNDYIHTSRPIYYIQARQRA
jgi:hypothetical protein